MKLTTVLSLGVVVAVLGFLSDDAAAQVAAATSDVPDCISLAPGGTYPGNPIGNYRVIVRDAASAVVPGALVVVTFNPIADMMIAWCPGQIHPALPGVLTDASGTALFVILGGGCIIDPLAQVCAFAPGVATVAVTGPPGIGGAFVEDIFCVNSPDVRNMFGIKPACPAGTTCDGAPPGMSVVGLSDAVYHTKPIKLGLIDNCTKFTPPFGTPVGVLDAIFLTPYIKNGNFCVCS